MRRRASHQLDDAVELCAQLVPHRRLVASVDLAPVLAGQVAVQPDREVRVQAAQRRRLLGGRTVDPQAGARERAVAVALEYPPVDARRDAEVIGTYDQFPSHPTAVQRAGASATSNRAVADALAASRSQRSSAWTLVTDRNSRR